MSYNRVEQEQQVKTSQQPANQRAEALLENQPPKQNALDGLNEFLATRSVKLLTVAKQSFPSDSAEYKAVEEALSPQSLSNMLSLARGANTTSQEVEKVRAAIMTAGSVLAIAVQKGKLSEQDFEQFQKLVSEFDQNLGERIKSLRQITRQIDAQLEKGVSRGNSLSPTQIETVLRGIEQSQKRIEELGKEFKRLSELNGHITQFANSQEYQTYVAAAKELDKFKDGIPKDKEAEYIKVRNKVEEAQKAVSALWEQSLNQIESKLTGQEKAEFAKLDKTNPEVVQGWIKEKAGSIQKQINSEYEKIRNLGSSLQFQNGATLLIDLEDAYRLAQVSGAALVKPDFQIQAPKNFDPNRVNQSRELLAQGSDLLLQALPENIDPTKLSKHGQLAYRLLGHTTVASEDKRLIIRNSDIYLQDLFGKNKSVPSTLKALDPRILQAWNGFLKHGFVNPETGQVAKSDEELMKIWGFTDKKDFNHAKRHLYGSIDEGYFRRISFAGVEKIKPEQKDELGAKLLEASGRLVADRTDRENPVWLAILRVGASAGATSLILGVPFGTALLSAAPQLIEDPWLRFIGTGLVQYYIRRDQIRMSHQDGPNLSPGENTGVNQPQPTQNENSNSTPSPNLGENTGVLGNAA